MKRNYDNQPMPKEKVQVPVFPCLVPRCNKKYRSEQKRQQHIEKNHYFETHSKPIVTSFSAETKIQIYTLAQHYGNFLVRIATTLSEEESLRDQEACDRARLLLPQDEHPSQEELERIGRAQWKFAQRFAQEELLTSCDWSLVLEDLRQYLGMGIPYFDTNFCPSLPIDFLWHACMQYPTFYKGLFLLGTPLPHCARPRTQAEDEARFAYFLKVFEHRFGRLPTVPSKAGAHLSLDELIRGQTREITHLETERRLLEEERQRKLDDFMRLTGVKIKYFGDYDAYYLPIYMRTKLTGQALINAVKLAKEEFRRRQLASSC